MRKVDWCDVEMVNNIIKESNNKGEVLNKLNLKNHGGNYNTLDSFIKTHSINIEHFYSVKNNIKNIRYDNIEDVLVENSPYKSTNHLKKRLIKEGFLENVCSMCGQGDIWNGKKISLILDHINGINDDNRLSNLRIVCPNCNATLDTHCGKNIKRSSSSVG